MGIIPDDRGLYNCPDCGCLVAIHFRYCCYCGKVLPLPPTINELQEQELADLAFGCKHELIKYELDAEFCPCCGKKL